MTHSQYLEFAFHKFSFDIIHGFYEIACYAIPNIQSNVNNQ